MPGLQRTRTGLELVTAPIRPRIGAPADWFVNPRLHSQFFVSAPSTF